MGELESALDALAADDLDGMVAPSSSTARRCWCGRATGSTPSSPAPPAGRAGPGPRARRADVHGLLVARALPAVAGRGHPDGAQRAHAGAAAGARRGCADGQISAEQVAVIAPVPGPRTWPPRPEQGVDLAGVDAALAGVAATRPYRELAQVVHHYLERLDPDGPEPDPTEGRPLSIAKHPDGSVTGRFELDAVGGEKVQAVLESMVQANRPAGDLRTRAQRLADAFVQWADNALAAGDLPILRTVKPHVLVMIGIDDLADPDAGPGAGEPASAPDLRRPGPLAGLRRHHHPGRHRPRRSAAGPRPQPPGVPPHLRRAVERPRPAASSPAAMPPPTGATPTIFWNGSSTTDPRRWTTARCSARATTRRSTTASGSNDNPTADGAPSDPTAPRSSCTPAPPAA